MELWKADCWVDGKVEMLALLTAGNLVGKMDFFGAVMMAETLAALWVETLADCLAAVRVEMKVVLLDFGQAEKKAVSLDVTAVDRTVGKWAV